MSPTAKHIFLPSGCLSYDTLVDAATRKLSEQDQKLVETHLKNCELCSEALEGFKEKESLESFQKNISYLKENFRTKIQQEKSSGGSAKSRNAGWTALRIAASILLLIGTIFVFSWITRSLKDQNSHSQTGIPDGIDSSIGNTASSSPMIAMQEIPKKLTAPAGKEIRESIVKTKKPKTKITPTAEDPIPIVDVLPQEALSDFDALPEEESKSEPQLEQPSTADESSPSFSMRSPQSRGAGPNSGKMDYFYKVEEMPRFRSGDLLTFRNFIQEQIRYPAQASETGVEGTVYIAFFVNPQGKVCDVSIYQGVSPELDKEALRAVKASPDWKPGKHNGKKVKVGFIIPVKFSLFD